MVKIWLSFVNCIKILLKGGVHEIGRDKKDPMDISTYFSITYILDTGIAFIGKMLWEMMQQF